MTAEPSPPVLHWRDFICPFCYVGQGRTALLRGRGWRVEELPFPIHPDIPPGGVAAGPRTAPFYGILEREAADLGLPLAWPSRLPDTRLALMVAEQVRRLQPSVFSEVDSRFFAAHFAEGRDIGDPDTVWAITADAGAETASIRTALDQGDAERDLDAAVEAALRVGVTGTPAWLLPDRLVVGLQPLGAFHGVPES